LASASTAIKDLSAVIATIQSGEGTLGKLVQDEELYNNLNEASANLDKLLVELRTDPRQFIPPLVQIGGKKKRK
jgi:phospholipid/cholesterol/gamma-HCH transport system substrate-binding protein